MGNEPQFALVKAAILKGESRPRKDLLCVDEIKSVIPKIAFALRSDPSEPYIRIVYTIVILPRLRPKLPNRLT